MFGIEAAGLRIGLDNRFSYVEAYCRDFRSAESSGYDFTVRVSEEELLYERQQSAEEAGLLEGNLSRGYCETVCFLRKIALELPRYDAFLLHAAAVTVDGRAYAFTAPSGTGKSTHIALWKKLLKDRMAFLNGDKPFVRYVDGRFLLCGNPWRGKENYGDSRMAGCAGLCFLKRGEENRIVPLSPAEASNDFLRQIYLPPDTLSAMRVLALADAFLKEVPLWSLQCNMDPSAAQVSFGAMSGEV